jgi:hypothetical protein
MISMQTLLDADVFWQYEVPEDDIQRLEPGITQRLKRIKDPRKDLD